MEEWEREREGEGERGREGERERGEEGEEGEGRTIEIHKTSKELFYYLLYESVFI